MAHAGSALIQGGCFIEQKSTASDTTNRGSVASCLHFTISGHCLNGKETVRERKGARTRFKARMDLISGTLVLFDVDAYANWQPKALAQVENLGRRGHPNFSLRLPQDGMGHRSLTRARSFSRSRISCATLFIAAKPLRVKNAASRSTFSVEVRSEFGDHGVSTR